MKNLMWAITMTPHYCPLWDFLPWYLELSHSEEISENPWVGRKISALGSPAEVRGMKLGQLKRSEE